MDISVVHTVCRLKVSLCQRVHYVHYIKLNIRHLINGLKIGPLLLLLLGFGLSHRFMWMSSEEIMSIHMAEVHSAADEDFCGWYIETLAILLYLCSQSHPITWSQSLWYDWCECAEYLHHAQICTHLVANFNQVAKVWSGQQDIACTIPMDIMN